MVATKRDSSRSILNGFAAIWPRTIGARVTLAAVSGTIAMTVMASTVTIVMIGSFWTAFPHVMTIIGAAICASALVIVALRGTLAPVDNLQEALEHYRDHGFDTPRPDHEQRGDLVFLVDSLLGRVQAELQQSRTVADTDPLTGLLNRRGFDRHLVAGERGSIIFVDLDRFKRVNDRLGHDAGDLVLSSAADLLRAVLRQGELVARFGGEEFVVFLPGTDLADASHVAERIRSSAERHLSTELGRVTISAGVAEQRPNESFAQALIRADRAAYRAKRAGRNCVRVSDISETAEVTELRATAAE